MRGKGLCNIFDSQALDWDNYWQHRFHVAFVVSRLWWKHFCWVISVYISCEAINWPLIRKKWFSKNQSKIITSQIEVFCLNKRNWWSFCYLLQISSNMRVYFSIVIHEKSRKIHNLPFNYWIKIFYCNSTSQNNFGSKLRHKHFISQKVQHSNHIY